MLAILFLVLVTWYLHVQYVKHTAWEDGFIDGHEAGHLDTLDSRPYTMEVDK